MKKIVFDLTKTQQSTDGKFHGGGKYGIEVFKKLAEIKPDSVIAYYNKDIYLNKEVVNLINSKKIPSYFSNEKEITYVASRENGIIYSPLFDKAYVKNKSIKVLITIHGIRDLVILSDKYKYCYEQDAGIKKKLHQLLASTFVSLHNKHLMQQARRKYDTILKSSNISYVTVSNHSKYAILSFFPSIKTEDLKVFYSPSTIYSNISRNISSKFGKYWLLVSGNRWIKNPIRAIMAFDQLFSERPEIEGDVVITGLSSLTAIKVKVINRYRFHCIGYVDEEELRGLYKDAYAFVYPTLFEGFGYPPLEAMHEGTPVIASAIASVPEVCGDAVLYFNPYSIPEIKMRILQCEDKIYRCQLAAQGLRKQKEIESKQNKDLENFCHYILETAKNSE